MSRTLSLPPLYVTRVSHVACDECGEQPIAFREENTVYPEQWCPGCQAGDHDA